MISIKTKKGRLTGTWDSEEFSATIDTICSYRYEFVRNGKFYLKKFCNGNTVLSDSYGSWSINEDMLITNGDDPFLKIFRLTSKELWLGHPILNDPEIKFVKSE